jgi:hypothetical protein
MSKPLVLGLGATETKIPQKKPSINGWVVVIVAVALVGLVVSIAIGVGF